jgi:hypothetical protein
VSYTLSATTPGPFVHFDNRGLVLSSEGRCAAFIGPALVQWAADTFDIVADEGRATRFQHERVLGGFRLAPGEPVVVFGGERAQLISLQLGAAEFERLRDALREAYPRRR